MTLKFMALSSVRCQAQQPSCAEATERPRTTHDSLQIAVFTAGCSSVAVSNIGFLARGVSTGSCLSVAVLNLGLVSVAALNLGLVSVAASNLGFLCVAVSKFDFLCVAVSNLGISYLWLCQI